MPTLAELAALLGGVVAGPGDKTVSGVAPVEEAGPDQITFLTDERYLPQLEKSAAGAVLIGRDRETFGKPAVVVQDARAAVPKLLGIFRPRPPESRFEAVHASAVVHPSAKLGRNVRIGPGSVIDAKAEIGDDTEIMPLCYVGWETKIGAACVLHPLVAVAERCVIGNRVIVHSGTAVGTDGFGFAPSAEGPVKIPQIGRVVIEDDVEIGANCTIDRAMAGKTVIKRGAKLDDQVHIAHNCVIGEGSLLAGQTGFGGSVTVGRGVQFGGQVGVADHLILGDGAKLGAKSGVHRNVSPGESVFGLPARPAKEAFKIYGALAKIPALMARIRELESRLAELERKERENK